MATYTLFGQTGGASLTADTSDYTMGVQFVVATNATLNAIWFNSPSGAGALPDTIALYTVSGQTLVHSESATWSGAAGSGWVRAAFSSPPALTSGTAYKGCIFEGTGNTFYGGTPHYWDTGAGSNGITNGPLSAPNNAGAAQGQDTFTQSFALAYPGTAFNAGNYWVDVEVSAGASHTATASLTITPAFHTARSQGHVRHASLTITPTFTATAVTGRITSRAIVRAGVAQFIGGTDYDPLARAYRGNGPLAAYGLSTVRAYTPKRQSDEDYVIGQSAGRGMGAAMIVEIPHDVERRDSVGGAHGGVKCIDYDIVLAGFHLAHEDHAEDAEYDVDLLIEAVKDRLRSDRTCGGIFNSAGQDAAGIEVIVEPSEVWNERTMTVFTVQFIGKVFIAPD